MVCLMVELNGATPKILPPDIYQRYTTFKARYIPSMEEELFHPLILFALKFFIPWVLAWY